jgi:organic hydroperoxide reductase OsmC/OhrA
MGEANTYHIRIRWTGNRGRGTRKHNTFSNDHQFIADGPSAGADSANSTRSSGQERWNQEQVVTASLAQCHMLWYLHLCVRAGVVVTAYIDDASGTVIEGSNEGRHLAEVVLRPHVTVASQEMIVTAVHLHEQASVKCSIVNTVGVPVRHEPTISVG